MFYTFTTTNFQVFKAAMTTVGYIMISPTEKLNFMYIIDVRIILRVLLFFAHDLRLPVLAFIFTPSFNLSYLSQFLRY
jgi:hypothetical protein